MNRSYFLIIISILLLACHKQDDRSTVREFQIDPGKSETFKFTDYYKDLSYLKLELDSLNPIGSINKLIKFGDTYLILDVVTNKVFSYSLDGNFNFVFAREGKGPGEYQAISNISVNRQDSILVVYDKMGMTIRQYSTVDGSFISVKKLKYFPLSVTYLGEGKMAVFMNYYPHPQQEDIEAPMNLIYTRDFEKILNGFLPFDPQSSFPRFASEVFTSSAGKTYFMPMFSDDVFLLDSESCTKLIKLSFGEYNFKQNIFNGANSSSERLDRLYKSDMVFVKSGFHEFSNYYFLKFIWKGIFYEVFINKYNGQVRVHKAKRNDINGFPAGMYVNSENDAMYYAIEPYGFIEKRRRLFEASNNDSIPFVERKRFKLLYEEIDSTFSQLNENDNPIIGIYKMK